MTAESLALAIVKHKFNFNNEKELQGGIAQVLSKLNIEFKAEVKLTARDRIDFLCGDIGIEIKTNDSAGGASLSSVTRQLWRYTEHEEISSLILVTTRSKHRNLPQELNGKSLYVVYLSFLF